MVAIAKQIPLKLLVHELQYEQYNGINRYGDDEYAAPISITNVRVEPNVEFKRDITENIVESKFVIFYDAINSKPNGVTFTERSKITFNGQITIIKKVLTFAQPFSSALHHIELETV